MSKSGSKTRSLGSFCLYHHGKFIDRNIYDSHRYTPKTQAMILTYSTQTQEINNRCPFEIESTSWLQIQNIFILFLTSHISMRGGLGVINFKVLHFKLPELRSLCYISWLCSTSRSVISFLQTGSSFPPETSNAHSGMQARARNTLQRWMYGCVEQHVASSAWASVSVHIWPSWIVCRCLLSFTKVIMKAWTPFDPLYWIWKSHPLLKLFHTSCCKSLWRCLKFQNYEWLPVRIPRGQTFFYLEDACGFPLGSQTSPHIPKTCICGMHESATVNWL